MTPKKSRQVSHNRHSSHLNQISDYETDPAVLTDNGLSQPPPPPSRTNEELNLAVLRRHNPSIIGIVSIAPYAVVYKFSATSSSWEKRGVEGTLFVVQLLSEQVSDEDISFSEPGEISVARFGVVVLNRRGLENFEAELKSSEDVEITEEYVILQVTDASPGQAEDLSSKQDQEPDIIGLWIFSEPLPSSTAQARVLNAQVIQECAKQAQISRQAAEEALQRARQQRDLVASAAENGQNETYEDSGQDDAITAAPMGRQLSLRQLFGQQRQDDDSWSIRGHNSPPFARTELAPISPPRQEPSLSHLQRASLQGGPQPVHLQYPAQPALPYRPDEPVPRESEVYLSQPTLHLPQPHSVHNVDTRTLVNGRDIASQAHFPQTSGQSGQPGQQAYGRPSASQQEMLLGLFQQARH
ncbi:MAG: hypothetical protein M1822_010201 [Bathelium mastoideum]|nr:MAG: hypothetical protein M1822_010201 [Bathelium mastoideum]